MVSIMSFQRGPRLCRRRSLAYAVSPASLWPSDMCHQYAKTKQFSGSSSPPTAFPPPLSTHRPNLPQHQGRQPSNGCCWLPFRPVCSSIHDKLRKLGGGMWVCGVKNGVLDRIMARALSRK
ncbi:hypothetical protein I305_06484 [Cryptococcus gattii E566]|uniref:Uncharacterized protein n=2 Tax=Cryptococcus gattii TaxID=37769 RepID=E6RD02_CRYGW|nr:Hypothetical Protein CGB_J2465W [Cryptococcus gattii WM276]ADV24690.1 Hypothetical Protein CGB_J2465W [Cryptococcus gattii WM276]KIR80179.1 hypothetical protein I306_02804 [Cryptococcus gattii EJB2]KIY31027.1 hypothetical protein I305_06484 [Cryptococcus gattii E566]KJE00649.1 hypothetical protein I311_05776 [Cryptococcus gattii NT-10]